MDCWQFEPIVMSVKKENSAIVTADCEELDYEEDEFNNSAKNNSVTLENDDDAEEGEILDADDNDCNQKRMCKFFQHSECSFGDKCPNLHVTDKGLYRMFDPIPMVSYQVPEPYSATQSFVPVCPAVNSSRLDNDEQSETALTDWDRALIEAKKLVKQWDKMVRPSDPIVITIESDDEKISQKLSKKPRRYKSPCSKVLPPNTSLTNSVSISPKQKLADKNKWHDPWRRSPIRRAEPINFFRRSSRKKCSSKSPVPNHSSKSLHYPRRKFSISDRRPPENSKNRQLSSNSSSSDTVHQSRKDNLKRDIKLPSYKREQQHHETAENLHKAHRSSSTVSSPPSMHSSRKEKLRSEKGTQLQSSKKETKNYHAIENKLEKCVKLSTFKRQYHKFLENRSETNSHQSSNINSPPSLYRSKKEWSTTDLKQQSSNQEKKVVPAAENKLERNLKTDEPFKKELTNRQSNDISQWTPKKVRPRTPSVQSCSDMSTSPLTDSSLSDLFDPDKSIKWMNRTWRHETSRSRSFQPLEKCQDEVYGPVCLPKNQPVAPSISVTKSSTIQTSGFVTIANLTGVRTKKIPDSPNSIVKNKDGDLSKSNQMKKRNFSALETDLLKFQRGFRFVDSEPTLSKNILHNAEKTKLNNVPKKDSQSQNVMETVKENKIQKEGLLIQSKSSSSRKEKILKQLEAINAAIERKKSIYRRTYIM